MTYRSNQKLTHVLTGTVSHDAAMEKAQAEYEKYRQKTANELSPAERDFLTEIKATQKKLEEKNRRKKKDEKTKGEE